MKKRIGLILVSTLLAGCMHTTCPTYSHYSRGSGAASVSMKKAKQPGKTPYYKTVRMAEQD